jgi:hypothetical protein
MAATACFHRLLSMRSPRRAAAGPSLCRCSQCWPNAAHQEISTERGDWSSPLLPVHPGDYCGIARPATIRDRGCATPQLRGITDNRLERRPRAEDRRATQAFGSIDTGREERTDSRLIDRGGSARSPGSEWRQPRLRLIDGEHRWRRLDINHTSARNTHRPTGSEILDDAADPRKGLPQVAVSRLSLNPWMGR